MNDLESDRVERTESVNKTDKFAQTICAFANDFADNRKPGYLIVGAKDDGTLSGLKVTDEILRNLAAIGTDGNVQPLPAMNVQKFTVKGGEVAVVEVLPSNLPPVRYDGRLWIRSGPRRKLATAHEELKLTEKRVAFAATFDARPCPGSSLSDLAIGLFLNNYLPQAVAAEVIAENQRSIEHQLASLRFFDLSTNQPTYAGIILFGIDPLKWIPGAYIQFVRLESDDINDDPIAQNTLQGDLQTVLIRLNDILSAHNPSRPEKFSILQERQVSPYPTFAIRELLMNAVMHRRYEEATSPIHFYWFPDHIEILSPGGLFGEASESNFPDLCAYRNPIIAEAMKNLGYVNRFGFGVKRAQAALERNGNPPAEFKLDPLANYVEATIRKAS